MGPTKSLVLHFRRYRLALTARPNSFYATTITLSAKIPTLALAFPLVLDHFKQLNERENFVTIVAATRPNRERATEWKRHLLIAPLQDNAVGNLSTFVIGRFRRHTILGLAVRISPCIWDYQFGKYLNHKLCNMGHNKMQWDQTGNCLVESMSSGYACRRCALLYMPRSYGTNACSMLVSVNSA